MYLQSRKHAKHGIGSIIKHLRYVQELSSKELADIMSVSQQFVSDVEANRRENLKQETLERFSLALRISCSDLIRLNELGKANGYATPDVLREILHVMTNLK